MTSTIKVNRRLFATTRRLGLLLALLLMITPALALAASPLEIDLSVKLTLERFHQQVEGSQTFAANAKGLLVMPNVKKAALIIGGEYGEGALLVDGQTVAYYNLAAASYGLQVGAQAKDIIIAFMTEESLQRFRSSEGWEGGVDGNIALVDSGGGKRIDTTTVQSPIVAFVFDVKGLIADVSFKGAKFTRIHQNR